MGKFCYSIPLVDPPNSSNIYRVKYRRPLYRLFFVHYRLVNSHKLSFSRPVVIKSHSMTLPLCPLIRNISLTCIVNTHTRTHIISRATFEHTDFKKIRVHHRELFVPIPTQFNCDCGVRVKKRKKKKNFFWGPKKKKKKKKKK